MAMMICLDINRSKCIYMFIFLQETDFRLYFATLSHHIKIRYRALIFPSFKKTTLSQNITKHFQGKRIRKLELHSYHSYLLESLALLIFPTSFFNNGE